MFILCLFIMIALGDDRRSFSYYKAIAVIEKLPFKIQNVEQVKHLPSIGKSMQDHVSKITPQFTLLLSLESWLPFSMAFPMLLSWIHFFPAISFFDGFWAFKSFIELW